MEIFCHQFLTEATTWYEMWNNGTKPLDSIEYLDLIEMSKDFYPAVADAIKIGATLPTTTCSIERSFSTLRRVKTWNRATMGDDRLSGLCMMSVHRKRLERIPNSLKIQSKNLEKTLGVYNYYLKNKYYNIHNINNILYRQYCKISINV